MSRVNVEPRATERKEKNAEKKKEKGEKRSRKICRRSNARMVNEAVEQYVYWYVYTNIEKIESELALSDFLAVCSSAVLEGKFSTGDALSRQGWMFSVYS